MMRSAVTWRGLVGLCLVILIPAVSQGQGTDLAHHYVLTDSKTNVCAGTFALSSKDLPDVKAGNWSIRQTVLHGGKQEGVELLTIDNGAIQITLIPTRGMNILDVRAGDLRLGWDSPVKEVVHPQFIDLDVRGGLGWLDGFNEWLVRCGLEYAGQAGKDEFVTNTGDRGEMNLTLHGKIGNLPASRVEVLIGKEPPHRIRVRGVVHERLFFGPKLELRTELSTVPGSDEFHIDDAVINHGGAPQEFQLIYHVNFGAPLLEKGARVLAPAATLAPMNAGAGKAINRYDVYEGPTAGFIEQVYLITPFSDDPGQTGVLLHNAAGNRGASMKWSTRELPSFTVWKNSAAEPDGYVTGLEPGTGFPNNRKVERQYGRVPKLAPGESRGFSLQFQVHRDQASVADAAKFVDRIRDGRKTEVSTRPPVTGK